MVEGIEERVLAAAESVAKFTRRNDQPRMRPWGITRSAPKGCAHHGRLRHAGLWGGLSTQVAGNYTNDSSISMTSVAFRRERAPRLGVRRLGCQECQLRFPCAHIRLFGGIGQVPFDSSAPPRTVHVPFDAPSLRPGQKVRSSHVGTSRSSSGRTAPISAIVT